VEEAKGLPRTPYPSIERIMDLDVRLRYLTHDARHVINQCKMKDDLNMYWQIILIEMCYNYSPAKVLGALTRSKKGKVKTIKLEEGGVAIVNTAHDFDKEAAPVGSMTLRTKLKEGVKIYGSKVREISFNSRQIWNLHLLDSNSNVSDYTVRWEEVLPMLDRMDPNSIVEIAGETGLARMNILISRIAEYLGIVDRSSEELAQVKHVVTPIKPVDPKAVEVLENALKILGDKEQ
jgi:hypothetical protein